MNDAAPPSDWLRTLRVYIIASLAFHLLWEILQLPLYTIWTTASLLEQAFAVFHCTAGDGMIAGLSLLLALMIAGSAAWPTRAWGPVLVVLVIVGAGYTIYSEWLNVHVRHSWAYSALMPTLPPLGTGLSPLLQWLGVPTLALHIARAACTPTPSPLWGGEAQRP